MATTMASAVDSDGETHEVTGTNSEAFIDRDINKTGQEPGQKRLSIENSLPYAKSPVAAFYGRFADDVSSCFQRVISEVSRQIAIKRNFLRVRR